MGRRALVDGGQGAVRDAVLARLEGLAILVSPAFLPLWYMPISGRSKPLWETVLALYGGLKADGGSVQNRSRGENLKFLTDILFKIQNKTVFESRTHSRRSPRPQRRPQGAKAKAALLAQTAEE